ncbi:MAG TPA: PAS domain S-box protein [Pelobium sp.]|nr:PAS domain S-box protein [Pelobium sp.]
MWDSTWKTVFIYIIASLVWVLTSDELIHKLALSLNGNDAYFLTVKDVFYVVVSSCIFYFIIRFQKRALARSEKQYKQLFFSNPNPLWIYDKKTLKFMEVNNATMRHYGYNREQFRKMTIMDIRPEEDKEKVVQAVKERAREYHISGNWRHRKKSGEVIMVSIASHGIAFNGRDCVMVMAQDITLNVKHEAELKKAYEIEKGLKEQLEKSIVLTKQSGEEKQKFAEVIDRINNMVIITNPYGEITWVNSAFTNFTGYSIDEIAGKTPQQVLHGPKTDPEIQNKITESLQKGEFVPFEVLNYTKSGEEYWVEFNLSAIYNDKNEIERYIAIQNVITERKEREEEIKAYNNALRKLAWTNSHAVRKPVASILGLVDLCKQTDQIDEIKKLQSLIDVCSVELDKFIREMGREISKYEIGDFDK